MSSVFNPRGATSALGQKQTSSGVWTMSALPAKADISRRGRDVCYGGRVRYRARNAHAMITTITRQLRPGDGAEIEAQSKDSMRGRVVGADQIGLGSTRRHEAEAERRLHDKPGRYEQRRRKYQRRDEGRPRTKRKSHDREIESGIGDSHNIVECPTDCDLARDLGSRSNRSVNKAPMQEPSYPTSNQAPVCRRKSDRLQEALPEICRQRGDNPDHDDFGHGNRYNGKFRQVDHLGLHADAASTCQTGPGARL